MAPISPAVTANVRPRGELDDDGPQAISGEPRYTGQFSENTPMRIRVARTGRGSFGGRSKTHGTIAVAALGGVVKMNDWNQYVVIARGSTFVQSSTR